MRRYRQIVARYGGLCRVVTATPDSVTREWVPEQALASPDECRIGGPVSPPVSLEDRGTMTDSVPFRSHARPPRPQMHETEPMNAILPTFRELPDPTMLRAPMQPARIHSVDLKTRTAVVSFSGSPEKVTRSWHDLIVLNPELLATYLVEHAA
jgi:hypothetical protein